ncbi:coadhesin-like [Bolinopsis microptera]|uniref:coadhesin-like n=1 Tax=Bolinopsis microptera TaxID=2820187 RepID=UPI003078E434
MRNALLLLLVILTLCKTVDARNKHKKKPSPEKACQHHFKKYDNCLKKGYVSTLGCKYSTKKPMKGKKHKHCAKLEKKAKNCGKSCAIDGGWTDFGGWSDCSAKCGGGSQDRMRSCDSPAPKNGGAECQGDDSESQDCNTQGCPVDGGWTDFGSWTDCSAECGGGSQERKRSCVSPAPENGGADCQGDDSESQDCNTQGCPVDGGWTDFGSWTDCSAECGGGSQERKRSCVSPAPENGGADCQGDDSESQDCNTQGCPVDGGWTDFGGWSDCSAECGGGSQDRMRSCDSPAPENGGAECQGGDVEIQACNIQGCPVDGGWTDFGSWTHCTVECGGGTMTKYRTCENPAPENGGAECQGEESKSIGCHEYACESDIGCWPKEIGQIKDTRTKDLNQRLNRAILVRSGLANPLTDICTLLFIIQAKDWITTTVGTQQKSTMKHGVTRPILANDGTGVWSQIAPKNLSSSAPHKKPPVGVGLQNWLLTVILTASIPPRHVPTLPTMNKTGGTVSYLRELQ